MLRLRIVNLVQNIKLNWATSGHFFFFTPFAVTIILTYITIYPDGHVIHGINVLSILKPICIFFTALWLIKAMFSDPVPKWVAQFDKHYDQEPLKALIQKHLYHKCHEIVKLSNLFSRNEANERITIYIQDTSNSFLRFFRFSDNEIQKNADPKSLPFLPDGDIIGTCFTKNRTLYHDFSSAESSSQWVKANRACYPHMDKNKLYDVKMKSKIYYAEQFLCDNEKIGVLVFETMNPNLKKRLKSKRIQKFCIQRKCRTICKLFSKEFKLYYKYVKIMKEVEGLENE